MSKFPGWFEGAYRRWSRSQPGEEDFLTFCDLLGYPPAIVLSWLQGETKPQGEETLSIAALLGISAYDALDQPRPDPELLRIFNSFSHLRGKDRGNLALALYEVEQRFQTEKISVVSPQAKTILESTFEKFGLNK